MNENTTVIKRNPLRTVMSGLIGNIIGDGITRKSSTRRKGNQGDWAPRRVPYGYITADQQEHNERVDRRKKLRHFMRMVRDTYGLKTLDELRELVEGNENDFGPTLPVEAFKEYWPDYAGS